MSNGINRPLRHFDGHRDRQRTPWVVSAVSPRGYVSRPRSCCHAAPARRRRRRSRRAFSDSTCTQMKCTNVRFGRTTDLTFPPPRGSGSAGQTARQPRRGQGAAQLEGQVHTRWKCPRTKHRGRERSLQLPRGTARTDDRVPRFPRPVLLAPFRFRVARNASRRRRPRPPRNAPDAASLHERRAVMHARRRD